MKIKFSLFAVAATLFLSGYKEHVAADEKAPVTKKLLKTSLRNEQSVILDQDGRPKSITWSAGGSIYIRSFTYAPGKIVYVVRVDGKKKEEGEYHLTGIKVHMLEWRSFDDRGDTTARNMESFEYNQVGLLSKHRFNRAWSEYSYDDHKNLVRTAHYNAAGKPTTVVDYTYTSTKDLFPRLNYFNQDGSGFFLPAFAVYLPASKKVTKVSTNEVTLRGEFDYELDTDGYVVKGKWDALSAGDADHTWTNQFQ
jgi:hypothetical protein